MYRKIINIYKIYILPSTKSVRSIIMSIKSQHRPPAHGAGQKKVKTLAIFSWKIKRDNIVPSTSADELRDVTRVPPKTAVGLLFIVVTTGGKLSEE